LLAPLLPRFLDEEPVLGPADVVHKDVHASVPRLDGADHALDALPLRHIGADDGRRGGTALLRFHRDLLSLSLVDLRDRQVHTVARGGQAGGPPDVRAAAGDDDALSRQVQFHQESFLGSRDVQYTRSARFTTRARLARRPASPGALSSAVVRSPGALRSPGQLSVHQAMVWPPSR